MLAGVDPESALPHDRVRALGGGRWELKVVIDAEFQHGLEKLKGLLSHVDAHQTGRADRWPAGAGRTAPLRSRTPAARESESAACIECAGDLWGPRQARHLGTGRAGERKAHFGGEVARQIACAGLTPRAGAGRAGRFRFRRSARCGSATGERAASLIRTADGGAYPGSCWRSITWCHMPLVALTTQVICACIAELPTDTGTRNASRTRTIPTSDAAAESRVVGHSARIAERARGARLRSGERIGRGAESQTREDTRAQLLRTGHDDGDGAVRRPVRRWPGVLARRRNRCRPRAGGDAGWR